MKTKETKSFVARSIEFIFDKELSIYSAGLSFNIIFAVIPFLMLGFYITSFFPIFTEYIIKVREFLLENIVAIEPQTIETYLSTFMNNYQKIGLIGLVTALYTNYIFLSMFDTIAQKIFACQGRKILSSIWIYIVVFTLLCFVISVPIGILVALEYLGSTIQFDIFPIQLFLSALVIFKHIPNRHIDTKNAVTSAIVATILIEALRNVFVYYVVYTKAYLTIYGSFAVLFLFFAWINISAHLFLLTMKFCAQLQDSSQHKGKQ